MMEEGRDSKKRNMDKRRETSRYAARDRRGKESHIFVDLKEVVPIVEDSNSTHLDRIALLRVSTAYCRFRQHIASVVGNKLDSDNEASLGMWIEDTITECLDGFVLVVKSNGRLLYTTESVFIYLGHSQTEMTGLSLEEFAHPDDYAEFKELTHYLENNFGESDSRSLVIRMKSVISPRGRTLNMKSAIYKPVSFQIRGRSSDNGFVFSMQGASLPAGIGSPNAAATAIAKGSEAQAGTFLTRHSCDMRITNISDRLNYLLKNELKTLIGTSFYELVHPCDCQIISQAMKEMFAKGHVRTPYYRLLAANKSVAWVITEANTIKHTSKGQKGQYIICLHYLVGIQPESESLTVSPDDITAGRMINIKKEIPDCGEYVGRQPEVVDADFVPVFSGGKYTVENCQPLSPVSSSLDEGDCKNHYEEIYNWISSDKPCRALQACQRQSAIGDPTLASAQVMARTPSPAEKETSVSYTRNTRRGSINSLFPESAHAFQPSSPAPLAHCRNQSLERCATANPLPCIPSICVPDNNSLPTNGQQQSTGVYALMPTSNTPNPTMPPANINSTYIHDNQSDNQKWEDLTGLAPYVPYDDELHYTSVEFLPDDLQEFLQDLPEWKPESSCIPLGQKAAINVNHEHNQCLERYNSQVLNSYESSNSCTNMSSQDFNCSSSYPNQYWLDPKSKNWGCNKFPVQGMK